MNNTTDEIEWKDLTPTQQHFVKQMVGQYKYRIIRWNLAGRQTGKTTQLKFLIKELKKLDDQGDNYRAPWHTHKAP